MDPETHSIINLVDKHGINPPTVCNLNEAFIEILGPVLGFSWTEKQARPLSIGQTPA